jgi:hypothetical protein
METISMSQRERHRLEVFSRVRRREITLVKASELLELSYRQAKRCFGRYRQEGDKGLVHRLRGQPSNRQADGRQKRRVCGGSVGGGGRIGNVGRGRSIFASWCRWTARTTTGSRAGAAGRC